MKLKKAFTPFCMIKSIEEKLIIRAINKREYVKADFGGISLSEKELEFVTAKARKKESRDN